MFPRHQINDGIFIGGCLIHILPLHCHHWPFRQGVDKTLENTFPIVFLPVLLQVETPF